MKAFKRRCSSRVAALAKPIKLFLKVVEKKRLDHLQDVLLGGVMRSSLAAFIRVHNRLKERTKDGRRDGIPGKLAHIQQEEPHPRIEGRNGKAL